MKRIIVLFVLLLGSIISIAQPVTQRGTTSVTVQDARLFAQYNFRPPVFPDTTSANTQIGLDSCGALIYSRDINAYYYRACSPKRWVRVSPGGSASDSAYFSYRPLTDTTFLLCRVGGTRCDTIKVNGKGVSTAWLIGGNVNPIPPYIGTIDTKELDIITNNVVRMRVAGNGINRSSAARNKFLTMDTTTRYLYYTDGGGGIDTIPSLQDVTDVGNTTNNQIIINNNNNYGFFHKSNNILGIRTYVSEDDNESFMEVFSPVDNTVKSLYSQSSIQYVQSNNRTSIGYETPTQINNIIVPNSSGRLALSVNGQFADSAGSITIPTIDTSNKWVNNIYRNSGVDSIYYTIGSTTYAIKDSAGGGTVTSIGLTMPSAFSVANSPVTTSGTIAVTGAGAVSQYIRGDGSLANFPTSTGGGSSVNYYLNGSVSQGTFGGIAFREMNKTPIIGAGTNFTINADGYIQSFITDAGDPSLLNIPAGNWNFEMYFSASSAGGLPSFYLELYKWNGTTLSLIASSSATPENITGGTAIDLYTTALAVPATTLLTTDRLAVRVYVIHSSKTITLHTENSHLCQIITTFSSGLTALNGLTEQVQNFATGTGGTDFNISSATATHTFNLPTASATNRGALSSANWSTFNSKISPSDTASMLTPYINLAGTGLTKSSQTLSSNLSTGVAGGQSVVGGTAASNSLTLSSTSNATKGKILFGTSAYDEVNNRLGIGLNSPTVPVDISATDNLFNTQFNIGNKSTGSNALTGLSMQYGTSNTPVSLIVYCPPNYVATGLQNTMLFASAQQQKLAFVANSQATGGVAQDIYFSTLGTNTNYQMQIKGNGNVQIGTNTDAGYKLDVNGTARVQGDITSTSAVKATTSSATTQFNLITPVTTNFPRGRIQVGQSNSDGNVGIYFNPLYSTAGAQKPVFFALATNNNVQDATEMTGSFFLSTTVFNCGTAKADGTLTGGVPITFSPAGTEAIRFNTNGNIQFPATNTASGTTGNQTINKTSGTVNIAAAGTTVTVTNSLVTASSIVYAVIRTNDATATIKNVVPAAGSFVINLNAATTAETSIGFFVIN